MQVHGDYARDGYALVAGLLDPQVTRAFLARLAEAVGGEHLGTQAGDTSNLLARKAFEVYGQHWPPMNALLWGLTPAVAGIMGAELLPSYSYLRIYREGDVCRVHNDRLSCEHSASLTLDYSDGEPWPLEVATASTAPSAQVDAAWGDEAHAALAMEVGDAVLYRGVERRHARTRPNPNGWSAHLFLHWVDRNGPYAAHALENEPRRAVNFTFA